MIPARFANAPLIDVKGRCAYCTKDVHKRLLAPVARRMKTLVCESYECKRKHNNRNHKLRRERVKA